MSLRVLSRRDFDELNGRQPLSFKDYGSLGAGVADAAPAIRAMMEASRIGKKSCYIPEGTYLLASVEAATQMFRLTDFNAEYDIRGAGIGKTILKLAPGMNANMFYGGNFARFRISHLTIDGNKANQTAGSGFEFVSGSNIAFDNLEILNPFGNGILLQGAFDGVDAHHLRIVGARTHTGPSNPSSGHGVAFSAVDLGGGVIGNVKNFRISNIEAIDCDGSGVNASHAYNGVINNVTAEVVSFTHDTGYAAVRCSNDARRIAVSNVVAKKTSCAVFLSDAKHCTVNGVIGEENYSHTVFVENSATPTENTFNHVDNVVSINPNRGGGAPAAVRLSLSCGNTIGAVSVEKTSGAMAYGIQETGGANNRLTAEPLIVGADTAPTSFTSMSLPSAPQERGTFNAELTAATAPTGVAYSDQASWWAKNDKLVTVSITAALTSRGTGGSGEVRIPIPFTVKANPAFGVGAANCRLITSSAAGRTVFNVIAEEGRSYLRIAESGSNVSVSAVQWSQLSGDTASIDALVSFLIA